MTESSTTIGDTGEIWFYGARLFPGSSVLGLTGPNLIPFIFDIPNNGIGLVESYSASLAPGTYTYYVASGGNDSENEVQSNTFSTDFVVSQVPEPLSLPLLGIAALAMLRRRTRSR